MKKTVAFGALALTLAAVNSTESHAFFGKKKSGKEVVKVWAWDKNFNVDIMKRAEKKYEASHPNVDIQVTDYGRVDIETKLNTGFIGGSVKALPDVVLIEDYSAKKYLSSYPGYFVNLANDIDYSKFADYKVKLMTDSEGTYGIPFDSGVTGWFYREDILAKAGYNADDLAGITWDDFIKIGNDVKAKTGVNIVPGDLIGDLGLVRIMMQSAGAWYFNEDGSVNIKNNKALYEALRVHKEMYDNKTMKPTQGWGEWVGALNSGDAAGVVTGIWIMGSIKSAGEQSGKWRVANTPKLPNVSSKNASNLGGSSWYVVEKGDNATAVDFLKTMYAGDDEFYQEILVNNGAVGTYLPSQKGSAYTKTDEFFGGEEIYTDFSGWIKEIPTVDYGVYVSEADAAMTAVLKPIIEGKISIQEGLDKAQKVVESQIR